MMSKQIDVRIAVTALLLMAAARVAGQKETVAEGEDAQRVFHELVELRESVGGSVLQGTLLEPPAEVQARAFRDGLERAVREAAERPGHGDIKSSPQDSAPYVLHTNPVETICILREHSATLDRIANEIERRRQYQHADQLRDTARVLRHLARRLDRPSTAIDDVMRHDADRPGARFSPNRDEPPTTTPASNEAGSKSMPIGPQSR